jgi:hypothetical protein
MKRSAKGTSLLGCADVDIRVGDSYYISSIYDFCCSCRPVVPYNTGRSLKFLRVLKRTSRVFQMKNSAKGHFIFNTQIM